MFGSMNAGKSDFVDALICGADIIYRALAERPQLEAAVVKKRIVLVTNFLDAVRHFQSQPQQSQPQPPNLTCQAHFSAMLEMIELHRNSIDQQWPHCLLPS